MRSAEALTGLAAGRMAGRLAGRMKIASIASIKWRISQREVDRRRQAWQQSSKSLQAG
ncbi:hypothetical protein N8295_02920 [Pseudomonadales bacterium]|nr:hypothetical protein [Pseudomonadales bacterium]